MSELTAEQIVEEIIKEVPVKLTDTSVRCPICGRFARKIEEKDAVPAKPVGNYCESCRWHSAMKCGLFEVVSCDLWQLVQAAPTNPTVRAQLLAACLVAVPEEIKEPEAIKNWIEFNVRRRDKSFPMPIPPRPAVETAVSAMVRFSDTEFGTCNYSVDRNGRSEVKLEAREVLEMANLSNSRGENMVMFMERIQEFFVQAARDYDINMVESDEYNHEEYSASDDSPTNWSFRVDWNTVHDQAKTFLRQNHPELYQQIMGRDAM